MSKVMSVKDNRYKRVKQNLSIRINKIINIFIEDILNVLPYLFLVFSFILFYFDIPPLEGAFHNLYIFLIEQLFTRDRINTLTTVAVVLIGFYVTIMSVFGANYSQAVLKISNSKLSKKFTGYAGQGLVVTFVYFVFTIFYDTVGWKFFIFIYGFTFLLVISNFIRFAMIILKMYDENINSASEVIAEEQKTRNELITILRQIKDTCNTSVTNNSDYFYKLEEKLEENKKKAKPLPPQED